MVEAARERTMKEVQDLVREITEDGAKKLPAAVPAPDGGTGRPSGRRVLKGKRATKRYCCSIYPGPKQEVDADFARAILELQAHLKMPVWFLVHQGSAESSPPRPYDLLDPSVVSGFARVRGEIKAKKPVALLV